MAISVHKKNDDLIISYLTLRKAIGWLGILLPFILLTGNYFVNRSDVLNNHFFVSENCYGVYASDGTFKSSISHYYYSTVGELFTGILCAVALFMFCYNGHEIRKGERGPSDKTLTSLAGLFALGIIVFPTGSDVCIKDNMRTFLSSGNTGNIHMGMAALFFVSLSTMSMVNFRRTGDRVSFGKKKNHNLFLLCGIAILVCISLIAIYSIWIRRMNIQWLNDIHPVFCLEAIALFFFGLSWLVKGQTDFYYLPKKLNQVIKRKINK